VFSLKSSNDIQSWAQVADEFSNLIVQLNTWAQQQHNNDGSHSSITANHLKLNGAPVGELTAFPVDPSMFAASAGAWTVANANVTFFSYLQFGQVVLIYLNINTSTITGATPTSLYVYLPQFNIPLNLDTTPNNQATQFVGGGFQWLDFQSSSSGSDVVTSQNVAAGQGPSSRRLVLGPGPASNGSQFRLSNNFALNAYCWVPLTANNAANPT